MENSKRMSFFGIRGKLVSAVCMLLVAVIMVVSSTYAWFTLSTAPEVSGIATSIGSNGALEIKLNKTGKYVTDDNINNTYGNLVDLSAYGLDGITLLPAALQINKDGTLNINNFVSIPEYGDDGRVKGENSGATSLGTYSDGSFYNSSNFGVRAVGSASGLSDRQLAFRNAKYAVSTYSSLAKNTVAQSLVTNGQGLGNIIMAKAAGQGEGGEADTGTTVYYSGADVQVLANLVGDLEKAIGYLETAYEKYIIAYAASKVVETEESANYKEYIYKVVESMFESSELTLAGIVENKQITVSGTYGEDNTAYNANIAIGEETNLSKALKALQETKGQVTAAKNALEAKDTDTGNDVFTRDDSGNYTGDSYTWAQINSVMQPLVDYNQVTVNGHGASYIKSNLSAFATAVIKEGCKIQMAQGSGVFSDIAEHCGNYSVNVTVDVKYGSLELEDFPATMTTEVNGQTRENYISTVTGELSGKDPSDDESGSMPMTEFYGYIIDLTFRTNASNSNLLLQADATDRIYDDNDASSTTQGGGSYMTFKATDSDFTEDQVKKLMSKINIVFFDTETGTIYAYAMLDVENATYDADGITAKMYIYENVLTVAHTTTVTGENGEQTTTTTYYYYTDTTTTTTGEGGATTTTRTYYTDPEKTKALDAETNASLIVELDKLTPGYRAYTGNDAVITALGQNQEVNVSALVYLDGKNIKNSDVAATSSVSVKMNLQFSSDATLTPMEYADLHQKAQTTTTAGNQENSTPSGDNENGEG